MKAILTALFVISMFTLYGVNLHVGAGYTYPTITAAYNAAQDGDSIIIHPGDYSEDIPYITKDLCIMGSTLNPADVRINRIQNFYGVFRFGTDAECHVSNLTMWNSYNGANIFRSPVTFENCIIENNEFAGITSGEYSNIVIDGCILRNNGWYGAYLQEPEPTRNCSVINSLIYNNGSSGGSYYGAGIKMDNGAICNCTIVNNKKGVTCVSPVIAPSLRNSIVYNNDLYELEGNFQDVEYCCIEGGWSRTTNIGDDPMFVDPENDDYNLRWDSTGRSPCIDIGDPSMTDPDGTRSDMGALRATFHQQVQYTFRATNPGGREFINWVCFPIMDDVYTIDNEPETFFYPLTNVLEGLDYEEGSAYVEYGVWHYPDAPDVSPEHGYKIEIGTGSYNMLISGFLANSGTEISLTASTETHWIGYFIEESQYALDALDGVLDDISQIKAKDWCLTKIGGGAWIGGIADYTLDYGEMVEIKCETACSFAWDDNLMPQDPLSKEATSNFIVDEDPDYIPVYLDMSAYSENMPQEVGMFADGELIGATVVDGDTTQVNAYVDDIEDLENAEVSFELYYGERSPADQCKLYAVSSKQTSGFVTTTNLFETESHYYQVTLGEGGNGFIVPDLPETVDVSNYPNPFNPETTISYSLPQDGQAVLKVYNLRGQLVKTLVNSEMEGGEHEVVWSGQDESGKTVSSGIYFLRMQTGGKTLTHKLMLLK